MNTYTARVVSMAVVLTLGLAPATAFAQGRGRGGEKGNGDGQRNGNGQGSERSVQGRSAQDRGARAESQAVARPRTQFQAPSQAIQPSQAVPPNQIRQQGPQQQQQRYAAAAPQQQRIASAPRYASPSTRYVAAPRYVPAPRYVVAPRYVYVPHYTTHYYVGRPIYQPYFSFVPHLHIGFGIYVGNYVPFPTWYDPYAYSATYNPYYRPGGSYGGISFDIDPYNATIYVDGNYVGVADEFSPVRAPLTLPAGRHRIDLNAPGWAPLSFDITVVPRQVIPYSGSLGH